MAKALFFGRLREAAGTSEREIALAAPIDLAAFRRLAANGDEELALLLAGPEIRLAVNEILLPRSADAMIGPGDEAAFLPPFSGG